jgi:HSP20 family protein
MAEKTTDLARDDQRLTGRDASRVGHPFRTLERFADEIDRLFDDVGVGRSWLTPRSGRSWFSTPLRSTNDQWAPEIEVYQRNNELVVRADLPGMKKDDVSVEIGEEQITISGERRQEQESERGGVYRSERRYGSFSRTIPVPSGAMTDQAKATFTNGVLEVTMPSPPEQTRARRLEITDASAKK